MPEEAVAREHGQRRPHDEQERCSVDRGERLVDDALRDVVAEEDDARLEGAPAGEARRDLERLLALPRQLGVPVGGDGGAAVAPRGVRREQALLEVVAVLERAAPQARHLAERAVQLGDPEAPGLGVQAVDVLGHHVGDDPARLEPRERAVALVRLRGAHPRPADRGARPVPAAHLLAPRELRSLDGPAWPRSGLGAAVIGNPRLGAQPGAGERDDVPPRASSQRRPSIL